MFPLSVSTLCAQFCFLKCNYKISTTFFRHGYCITPICPVSGYLMRERMQVLSSRMCHLTEKSCSQEMVMYPARKWSCIQEMISSHSSLTIIQLPVESETLKMFCNGRGRQLLLAKSPRKKSDREDCRIWREKRKSPEGSDIVKTQHNCFCFLSMTVAAITNQSSLISHH